MSLVVNLTAVKQREVSTAAASERILTKPAPKADVRLPYGGDPLQFADLRLPDAAGPHAVAIIVHGGYWRSTYDLTHAGHLAAALTAAGVATWNVEYRRLGNPGGGWPGTFEDVARGADFVRNIAEPYDLDLGRVIAVGHSAGGQLALWLGARHRLPADSTLYQPDPLQLRAAVALAGVTDLVEAWRLRLSNGVVRELMGGIPDEVPARYAEGSPAELLPFGLPQLLIHGTADDSVPFALSEAYLERAVLLGDTMDLITLAGTGHFELIDPESAVWKIVRSAILERL